MKLIENLYQYRELLKSNIKKEPEQPSSPNTPPNDKTFNVDEYY